MRTAGLIPVVVFDMLGSKSKDKEEENRRRLEKGRKRTILICGLTMSGII